MGIEAVSLACSLAMFVCTLSLFVYDWMTTPSVAKDADELLGVLQEALDETKARIVESTGRLGFATERFPSREQCVAFLIFFASVVFAGMNVRGIAGDVVERAELSIAEENVVADVASVVFAGFDQYSLVAAFVVTTVYTAIFRYMYYSRVPHHIPKTPGTLLTLWWMISFVLVLQFWTEALFRWIFCAAMGIAMTSGSIVYIIWISRGEKVLRAEAKRGQ
jgi:hypothetical protein